MSDAPKKKGKGKKKKPATPKTKTTDKAPKKEEKVVKKETAAKEEVVEKDPESLEDEPEKDTKKDVTKVKAESTEAKTKDGDGALDEEELTGTVQLVSKDKKEFKVEKKWAAISALVKTTLEQESTATSVPILSVSSSTLTQVVEYMSHHKGTEPPIVSKPLRVKEMKLACSDPWDATFIDAIGETPQQLYDLILAANYMDVKSLLHLACCKVAHLVKGQPVEKIREILTKGITMPLRGADDDKDGKDGVKDKDGKDGSKKAKKEGKAKTG